jgi:hypothetical protein
MNGLQNNRFGKICNSFYTWKKAVGKTVFVFFASISNRKTAKAAKQ